MKRELKGCIFDLDGVIVDTAKYHLYSWQKLASNLGFEFTEEDNEQLKGISRMASLEIVLAKGKVSATEAEKIAMCANKNDWYIEFIKELDRTEILEGVEELLLELREQDIKIALGSASKNARMVLEKLGIMPLFDTIVDGNDVKNSKPDPEVFLKAAKQLGLKPEECVVFEDAEKGLIAAKAGNFKCLGIGTDSRLSIADKQFPNFKGLTLKELRVFWSYQQNKRDSFTKIDEWKLIQDSFNASSNEIIESLCSIGNAQLGQRANFEEYFSGKTFSGSYIAGIYYPDKTKVGWWKNGYPEYFAKVLNSVNWIGLDFWINGKRLDLNTVDILSFNRTLNMESGILSRECELKLSEDLIIKISSERFYSMTRKDIACLEYKLKVLKGNADIKCSSYFDLDVQNMDSNYDEKFWTDFNTSLSQNIISGEATTKKTGFKIGISQLNKIQHNNTDLNWSDLDMNDAKVIQSTNIHALESDEIKITKYCSIQTSRYQDKSLLIDKSKDSARLASESGFDVLTNEQHEAWSQIWSRADIQISGDVSAQQAIRFNIFHLNQTYDGSDARLNIGPKGFTGEKYGGSTYWDTEAYCLPFYLYTADQVVSENLLKYRHQHLEKAIENATKLGFSNGAALYPMVTMNGEECHNEWEITFEEIHRNGAIAYAIYDYSNHFNDDQYIREFGIDVLVAISRFWAQRVQYSEDLQQYVMLGVTGPNEYENNVDNNWYTNYLAKWCLEYTMGIIKDHHLDQSFQAKTQSLGLSSDELNHWKKISENMYFPYNQKRDIYLQQDGFLNKDLTPVDQLDPIHLPLNQKWSWDRILRSAYIKQADVLQCFYFFEDDFSNEELARHYDFYEPLTVHESSLSPCVHSILAAKLNRKEKAYEMYLRTARLDLDNYNNDTEDGLHITSMAGTWMSIVKGFAGARVKNGEFHFRPCMPDEWQNLKFSAMMQGDMINISLSQDTISFNNDSPNDKVVFVNNQKQTVGANSTLEINYQTIHNSITNEI